MVFIGLKAEMNEQNIRNRLDACLIEDYLTDPDRYKSAKDPFPVWFKKAS